MVCDIYGVKVGGVRGENPPVMVGSMFHKGHKIVQSRKKGAFIHELAEEVIQSMLDTCEKTGLSTMIDMVAVNRLAAGIFLDFVVEVTEMPILLDVLDEDAMMESLDYAAEIGVMDRIIVNSLNPHSKDKLYQKIKEVNCKSAILLLYSNETMLKSNKNSLLEQMLPKVKQAGIENFLVDTAVVDIPTLGLASKAIHNVKDQYGYPAGCGAHNSVASWKKLKTKFTKDAAKSVVTVANALPVALGADFILYGAAESAPAIFPSVAMIETAFSQLAMERGKRPKKSHPRYTIGR
jgi:tetrahydromethanopterin S-methyltransferase subunit H